MKRIDLSERRKLAAHNRCSDCGHEWRDRPVGFAQYYECPRCTSLYWVWLNYERASE